MQLFKTNHNREEDFKFSKNGIFIENAMYETETQGECNVKAKSQTRMSHPQDQESQGWTANHQKPGKRLETHSSDS
jgi:hypothetical protein